MNEWISIIKPWELNIRDNILSELTKVWIWWEKIVAKLNELMDARTLNNRWNEMADNKAQLEALKLILKIYWMKIDPNINVNLFNIPNPNERLKF